MQGRGMGKTVKHSWAGGWRSQEREVKWKWGDQLAMGPETLRTIDAYGTTAYGKLARMTVMVTGLH